MSRFSCASRNAFHLRDCSRNQKMEETWQHSWHYGTSTFDTVNVPWFFGWFTISIHWERWKNQRFFPMAKLCRFCMHRQRVSGLLQREPTVWSQSLQQYQMSKYVKTNCVRWYQMLISDHNQYITCISQPLIISVYTVYNSYNHFRNGLNPTIFSAHRLDACRLLCIEVGSWQICSELRNSVMIGA